MPDFSGPVQPVVVSRALVVLLVVPIATALVHFAKPTNATKDKEAKKAARTRQEKWNRNGALVTALLAVVALAALFAQPAGERFFVQHLVRWLRAGELDANFDLACDPTAALLVLGAAGLAALGASATTVSAGAILAAATFVILSGDLAGASAGMMLVAVLATPLVKAPARAFAFAAAATMAVATALLFWGTGGEWHPDGYGSDFRARLAAVTVSHDGLPVDGKAPPARGQGLLTVTAYPGSPIFLDDSHTALERNGGHLDTPFARLPLPAGVHSVRVHPGLGEDDLVVTQQAMGDGRELALVPIGSTLSPRALADELSLVDANGATSWRDQYLARRLFGSVRVAAATAWLFVLVALLSAATSAWSAFGAKKTGTLGRANAALITLVGASGAAVLLRLRAPLSLATSPALIVAAIGVALVLAALPLVVSLRAPARDKPRDEATAQVGDSWLARASLRFAAFPELVTTRLGSSSPSSPGARASTVDAAFGAFVLLFILLLVLAR